MIIENAAVQLLAEFGSQIGVADLAFNEEGACALSFDELPPVNMQYKSALQEIWLYADLGVPAGGPAIYETLLRGNYFWDSTLGATISLSGDDTPHVILARPVAWRGLDGPRMALVVETFVNTIRDWQELMMETADDDEEGTLPDDSTATFLRL